MRVQSDAYRHDVTTSQCLQEEEEQWRSEMGVTGDLHIFLYFFHVCDCMRVWRRVRACEGVTDVQKARQQCGVSNYRVIK